MVEYLPDSQAVRIHWHEPDQDSGCLFLHNLLLETRELSPEDRRHRIQFWVEGILVETHDPAWEDAEPRLRPVIQTCTAGMLVPPGGALSPLPLGRPFVPFLEEQVVIDSPRAMQSVVQPCLPRWGVSAEEVFSAASRNAPSLLAEELEPYHQSCGPVLHLPGQDDYAASRLLVPGWLEAQRGRVEGRPLAIIPERTMLFVAGDQRAEAAEWLAEAAEREWQAAARPLSPAVYTVDDHGSVVPYCRPGTDKAAVLVRRGHALLLSREYARQKAILDQLHARQPARVIVATAHVVQKGGRVVSYATWTDCTNTLLPRVDAVVVQARPDNAGRAAWAYCVPFDTARTIAGEAWTVAEVPAGPPRFRVSGATSDSQVGDLRRAAVSLDQIHDSAGRA